MSELLRPSGIDFEQKYRNYNAPSVAHFIENDSLILADIAIRFSAIERVPRYDESRRENDAEHSFMLGLIAQEIAARYFPELNAGLVAQFALVHDLLELVTGDVATFLLTDNHLLEKEQAESRAIDTLCSTLPLRTAQLLRIYEEQDLPEARLVRMVDKMMPVLVDILGSGSKVMHEDYATFDHEQLAKAQDALRARFERMFPEPELAPIRMARNGLARRFRECFIPLAQLQDVLF